MDRIQLRRDTSARWAEINPILLEGEVGFEIDTKLRKIGDGVNRWNDLEYLKAEGISQEKGDSQNVTMSQDAITRELYELGSKYKNYANSGNTLYNGELVEGTVVADKIVRYYSGEITDSTSGFDYKEWAIDETKNYVITAKTSGVTTALAVYKDMNGNYLGYEERASEESTTYYQYRLNIPIGATKLYYSGTKRNVREVVLIEANDSLSVPVKKQVSENSSAIETETKNIADINNKMNNLIIGETIEDYTYNDVGNWELGAISEGNNASNSSRIRTKDYFIIEGDGYFRRSSVNTDILESYSAIMYIYDRNKTYLGNKSLQLKLSTILETYPTAYYYRIVAYSFTGTLTDILDYVSYMSYGSDVVVKHINIDETAVIPRLNKLSEDNSNNPLYGKKILFVGDSVMAATANDGGWAKLIGQGNNMNWKNIAAGGSTIRRMTDGRRCILDDLKAETGDYDYVIIQGGLNDASNKPSTLNGVISDEYEDEWDVTKTYPAMEELCRYALTHYANKKVGFLISYIRGTGTTSWMTYADNLIKICKKWGMPYFDLRECAGFNLVNIELRALYGNYLGESASYNEQSGYAVDDIVNYNGKRYKANDTIIAPAGLFDENRWTYIGTDYDAAHCNMAAYKLSAPRIESWIKSL